MLQLRPAGRQHTSAHLFIRMHFLRGLCAAHIGRRVPQLRRRVGGQAAQTGGQIVEQPRFDRAGLQPHGLRIRMNSSRKVHEVPVPAASGLLHSLNRIDFADAYQVPLSHPVMDIGDAYMAIFGFAPTWVRWLMSLRGHIAVRLGLAHPFDTAPISFDEKPRLQPGVRAGPFTVQSISTDEIIVGDNDKHLNFRISVLKTECKGQCFVTVSTGVEMHNRLGRIYMFVVKPFHRFIASFMIQQAVWAGRL